MKNITISIDEYNTLLADARRLNFMEQALSSVWSIYLTRKKDTGAVELEMYNHPAPSRGTTIRTTLDQAQQYHEGEL